MGNYTSCCFQDQTSKLLDSNGNLKQLKLPITAAELMLEQPGHVVCPAEKLSRTCRIQAMRADDEILAGKLYLLVPLSRVNCKVSELETAMIESACEKKLQRHGTSKVLPAVGNNCKDKGNSTVNPIKVLKKNDGGGGVPGHCRRSCRQWSPDLEPISEVY